MIALPLQERAVAVALKHIFDKIKELEEEETRETQKVHQTFIARFKEIEQKVELFLYRQATSSRADPFLHKFCKIGRIFSLKVNAKMSMD